MNLSRDILFFRPGASDAGDSSGLLEKFTDERSELRAALGGKGTGLHLLSAMGFRVPAGFTIPADFCRSFHDLGGALDEHSRWAIRGAIQRLETETGRELGAPQLPLVLAVRSGAAESMPGMMDTVLGVGSAEDVLRAVERVFRSWMSRRAIAYRQEKGIVGLRGTAANVQVLCAAERAGVAFSLDPGRGVEGLLIEAVEGLGEKLVSGDATPDRYRVAKCDPGRVETETPNKDQPILTREEVNRIAAVTVDLERRLGFPVDIEWAISGGEIHLLQVRRIKVGDRATAVKDLLRREAARVRGFQGASGGDSLLVRYNLDETLSHPSPLAWDVVGGFFGGGGGFLGLYRDLGFRPSDLVLYEGFLVLVCGRVFADLERAAQIFYGTELLRHDPIAVRENPALIVEPPRLWDRRAATPLAAVRTLARVIRSNRRIERLRHEFPERFVRDVLPSYLEWCERKREERLDSLPAPLLLDEAERRIEMVFDVFARDALKMSFFAGLALADLQDLLQRALGEEAGTASLQVLISGLDGDAAVEQRNLLLAVGRGEAPVERFLERHGHRAPGEMDLSRPRWREDPEAALAMARALASRRGAGSEQGLEDLERSVLAERERIRARFLTVGGAEGARRFEALLDSARALLPWREAGKGHWMLGFDVIRRAFLELDRRLVMDGCVFQFTRAELREILGVGGLQERHRELSRRRREEDRIERSLVLPDCLTAQEMDRLAGEAVEENEVMPPPAAGGSMLKGTPLAPGRAEERAWLCTDPRAAPPTVPYILVCASPDTGWTPLLCSARALIVERGGVLSHGAVVARELGLPAVVLPRALSLLEDGRSVSVDGTLGVVGLAASPGRPEREETPVPRGATSLPPEPYVPAATPGLGARTALWIATALLASALIVLLPGAQALFLPPVSACLDWILLRGVSPFWAIASAAAIAALVATLLQFLAADRRRLRGLRKQLSWYRRQSRELARATSREGPTAIPGSIRMRAVLERRRSQATVERTFELIRPAALSFLPFCLAFIWVENRFHGEPIRPGTIFTVECCFRRGAPSSRHARLDCAEGLSTISEPRQKMEPDPGGPEAGSYHATWKVEAVKPGKAWVAVTTRDERAERDILVTERREFARDGISCIARPNGPPSQEIIDIRVRLEPVQVVLPEVVHSVIDGVVKLFRGGQGVTREQTAWTPFLAFLAAAVLAGLVLQRLAGLR